MAIQPEYDNLTDDDESADLPMEVASRMCSWHARIADVSHAEEELVCCMVAPQMRLRGRSWRQRRTLMLIFAVVSATLVLAAASSWCGADRLWMRSQGLEQKQDARSTLLVEKQDNRCCKESTAECFDCIIRLPCTGHDGVPPPQCRGQCGPLDDHHDYFGGDLYSIGSVADPHACCSHCRAEPNCTAWTWGTALAYDPHSRQRCYLKRQLEFTRFQAFASTSGFPGDYLASFQIKNRHGLCMARRGDRIVLEDCGDASSEKQRWSVDVRRGRIMTQDGQCLGSPQWKRVGGMVHLRPCLRWVLGQNWVLEGTHGLIHNKAGFCVAADGPLQAGTGLTMDRCNEGEKKQQWGLWFTSSLGDPETKQAMRVVATTSTTTTFRAPGTSLFCFALMLPTGGEQHLMMSHAGRRESIFGCEENVVFSSARVHLGSGIWTQKLHNTNVYVGKGGPWNTYLNTPVFIACWNQIRWSGRYKKHDWVVKVDPDTVFLPQRLRQALRDPDFNEAEIKKGLVINNCDTGLHGPLEVLSTRAMEVFGENLEKCEPKPQEDYFLSKCLVTLGVDVLFRSNVLADQGCKHSDHSPKDPDWWKCESGHVAFHPFKTPKELEGCYARAMDL